MASTFYRGEEGIVKFAAGATTPLKVASTRSWSFDITRDTIETSSQGTEARTFVASMFSGSGSVELLFTSDSDDTASGGSTGEPVDEGEVTQSFLTEITTAATSDNTAPVAKFELYMDSTKKLTFDGIITGTSYSSSSGDLSTASVSFITTGAITTSSLFADAVTNIS